MKSGDWLIIDLIAFKSFLLQAFLSSKSVRWTVKSNKARMLLTIDWSHAVYWIITSIERLSLIVFLVFLFWLWDPSGKVKEKWRKTKRKINVFFLFDLRRTGKSRNDFYQYIVSTLQSMQGCLNGNNAFTVILQSLLLRY